MISDNEFSLKAIQARPLDEFYYSATGPLPYTMTNDAIFHMVFEANEIALRGFLSALLRLKPEEIVSVTVQNPIQYNMVMNKKKFILDLKILLNNNQLINLEMQVEKLSFWKDRSLGYLCRAYDNLNKGQNYMNTHPAVHIGILDFDLFPDEPEFYGSYHVANDVTHQKYSDKFKLSVLNLEQIDKATDEDKIWNLDIWAKFFKATTWEEVHMLAEESYAIGEAARTLYRITSDEQVRYMCEAISEGDKTYRTLVEENEGYKAIVADKNVQLIQKDAMISEKDAMISEKNAELSEKNVIISEQNAVISEKDEEIARLSRELELLRKHC